jgi:hypothetical protein
MEEKLVKRFRELAEEKGSPPIAAIITIVELLDQSKSTTMFELQNHLVIRRPGNL